jgi:hypothetical protein
MKLYTEEQVLQIIGNLNREYFVTPQELLEEMKLTPIQLPSHQEIWEEAIKEELNQRRYDFMRGADFVRDKIQGQ